MAEKTADIRIVKKRKGHGGHHGGAWKVAYADFVTAMMAFFLVMWIVGMSKPVQQHVAGYFKDPGKYKKAVAEGKNPIAVPEEKPKASKERKKLEEAKQTIEKMVAAAPEFKNIKDYIDIKLVDEGLRVDLLEAKESLFFDSASAQIKPSAKMLLAKIGTEFGKLPNRLIVEGHTDNRALDRDGYTNWELSADRANSARRVMECSGLQKDQIAQVRGYADTQPRNPKDPSHFSNRRVSIIVVMKEAMNKAQFSTGHEAHKKH